MSKTAFDECLQMYKDAGMIDDVAIEDIQSVIKMFQDDYGITLVEENASMFIAHLCMAYMRHSTKEEVPPLTEENKEEIAALPTYPLSLEILDKMQKITENNLLPEEDAYILLHLNALIQQLEEAGEWPASTKAGITETKGE